MSAVVLAVALASPLTADEPGSALGGTTNQRGFAPDQAFAVGEIDHVNRFNGNLVLTIPIGQSYPVSSALSYQLVLSYNARLWDFEQDCSLGDPQNQCEDHAEPHPGFNAGAGWQLSLGRLLAPSTVVNDSGMWLYVSPDGASHPFWSTLHQGETSLPSVSYTRDGSYLRMKDSGGLRQIEFPDGERHVFQASANPDVWLPILLADPFGNEVTITYSVNGTGTVWTVTDPHDRTQVVQFEPGGSPAYPERVKEVRLTAFGGATAIYGFGYDTAAIEPGCPDDRDPYTPHLVTLPFLTSISRPDGTSFAMPIDGTNKAYHVPSGDGCSDTSGYIRYVTLPTLGRIEWTYRAYSFPFPYFQPGAGGLPTSQINQTVWGVATRTIGDRDGTALGTWTYTTALDAIGFQTFSNEMVNTVTDPLGHMTKHYFSVDREGTDGVPEGPEKWRAEEYGLPITRKVTETVNGSPGDPVYLSTRVFSPAEDPQDPPVLVRSTYLRFERDPVPCVEQVCTQSSNRRVAAELTVYHDDDGRRAETLSSDFDGLGHYREIATGGTFAAGNERTVTTYWNPDAKDEESGEFVLPAEDSPWLLSDFDRRETTEGSDTEVQTFCFDESTGFLMRRRAHTEAGQRRGRDVVVEFTDDGSGNVERERYFGGDKNPNLSVLEDLCGFGLPGLEIYEIQHEYAFGTRKKTEYLKQDGTLFQELFDHAIDASTGLIASTTDPAGFTTTFDYDGLGRLTQELPEPGAGARVSYEYVEATATSNAQVEVERSSNPGGVTLAEEIVVFDDFGRVFEEKRRLPDGTFNLRQTLYDAKGQRASVSELVPDSGTPEHLTRFLDYDPFGRPTTIRPADGETHDVTLAYKGVSEVSRTVKIAGGDGDFEPTTTEVYDRQGRLYQVVEPIGPTGSTTTTYEYDAGNRLKKVSMADGTTTQVRKFVYDGRGFLDYEKHPEKGVSGNGTVDYALYDARGNVGKKIDSDKTLVFTYDRAERLEEVQEEDAQGQAGPLLKEFTYGSSGLANGKLESATRHNHLSEFNHQDLQIKEVFTYGGRGGRVSKRETERADVDKYGGVLVPSEKWFETDFTWTELGEIASITYPTCTIPTECTASGNPSGQPARIVSYGWVNGFLKTVDFVETASTDPDVEATVSYHPNEMLESVAFSYFDEMSGSMQPAATTSWDQDQNSMPRPARIYTSGVTGGSNFDTGIYAYDGAGNVKSMTVDPLSDTFAYDGASRLVAGTAGLGTHVESSAYDAFGNRVAADTPELGYRTIPVDAATNRLLGTVERPVAYDERGNQKLWGTAVYTYDGFNQMILQQDSGSGADFSYVYTADDERIAVVNNSVPTETWYLRDLDGLVLRKFYRTTVPTVSWQKDTIHRQGQVLATDGLAAGVEHAHLDHLGTIRLWTDRTGASPKHLTYSAFGEEIGDNAVNRDHQFTGHERDRLRSGGCTGTEEVNGQEIDTGQTFETCGELSSTNTRVTSTEEVRFRAGESILLREFTIAPGAVFVAEIASGLSSALQDLDYMHARYCSPVQGRFLSIDPVGSSSPNRPQSWNRYSYALNSPLKYVDPDGRTWTPPEWANSAASIGAGFLPYLGEFQDFTIAATGIDPITSRPEPTSTRVIAGGALAVPFVGGKAVAAAGEKLRGILRQLFRSGDEVPGGTAGAVRRQLATGELVQGKDHIVKSLERSRQLKKLIASGTLSEADQALALATRADLQRALEPLLKELGVTEDELLDIVQMSQQLRPPQ